MRESSQNRIIFERQARVSAPDGHVPKGRAGHPLMPLEVPVGRAGCWVIRKRLEIRMNKNEGMFVNQKFFKIYASNSLEIGEGEEGIRSW